MTRYYDFNHRGAICAFDQECEKEALTREERAISRTLKDLNARYFVVMKRIDDDHMLVAPVFTKQPRKDGKRIQINGKKILGEFYDILCCAIQDHDGYAWEIYGLQLQEYLRNLSFPQQCSQGEMETPGRGENG